MLMGIPHPSRAPPSMLSAAAGPKQQLLLGEGAKEAGPDPRVYAAETARRDPSEKGLCAAHEAPPAGLRSGAREKTRKSYIF